ncbi:uncharacterized protein LOC121370260 [Gigantopelta aegis]|uniref:uncharacterized protein LOC121370260 n=1 Tax=Gigantopelta aegis TaxID=1735272 RepID=UPI001B889E93|nr:uncharacterized protein LOC121370260 [Gigantopelta aegis]
MASCDDPDSIEYLGTNSSVDNEGSDGDRGKGTASVMGECKKEKVSDCSQVRHRMHRSAVRPFFCCGSELSLISLVDSLDVNESAACSSAHCRDPVRESGENAFMLNKKLISKSCHGTDVLNSCTSCRRSSLPTRRKKTEKLQGRSKKKFWSLKLRAKVSHGSRMGSSHSHSQSESPQCQSGCVCALLRRRDSDSVALSTDSLDQVQTDSRNQLAASVIPNACVAAPLFRRAPLIDMSVATHFDELYPAEDVDELRLAERAEEIEHGIELNRAPFGRRWMRLLGARSGSHSSQILGGSHSSLSGSLSYPALSTLDAVGNSLCHGSVDNSGESRYSDCSNLKMEIPNSRVPCVIHTQVDYVHCLVPDLRCITSCSFYWGIMDRYEAERLLDSKPEGTFLLRDSAQEEFLFSVSFRRYSRSLHARIEQWNHKFSFDAHDPAVYACDTVCGLIEHYKDPNCCMFFEPMLTLPLNRKDPFSLQHLSRSEICCHISYDEISMLPLPNSLKQYLKYYHYKQKVRVRRLDII